MEKKLSHTKYSFEEEIKNKLESFEAAPSPHIWANIQQELHPEIKRPKGIFWLQPRILLSGIGLFLLVAFSSASAHYLLKNIANEYHLEKLTNTRQKDVNMAMLQKLNQQQHTLSQVAESELSSETHSNKTKITNYIEDLMAAGASEPIEKTATKATANQTNYQTLLPGSQSSPVLAVHAHGLAMFDLIKMQVHRLEEMNSTTMLRHSNHEEEEVNIIKNFYNLKGFYIGAQTGVDGNFMAKNGQYKNPILGQDIHYSPNASYQAGMVLGYNLTNHFGIESGVNYMHKIQQFKSYNYDAIRSGTMKLTYIEVPLDVKYKINQVMAKSHRVSSINIFGGIQYAYLARANVAMQINNARMKNPTQYDGREYLPIHNLGLNIGVDYDLFVSKNLYWTIGVDGSVTGDIRSFPVWNKNTTSSPSMTIGVHTSIRFFKAAGPKPLH
jgi:Outer membrane protein beta-barrel domain